MADPIGIISNTYLEREVVTPIQNQLNTKISGVTFNGSSATVTGNVATITAATPGTITTTASTAQATASSESLSGAISLHKIAKTGSYDDLLNKPTIPDAGVFIAVYGQTTNADIWSAFNSGKTVILKFNVEDDYYQACYLSHISELSATFSHYYFYDNGKATEFQGSDYTVTSNVWTSRMNVNVVGVSHIGYGSNFSAITSSINWTECPLPVVRRGNKIYTLTYKDDSVARFVNLDGFTGGTSNTYSLITVTSGNVWTETTGISLTQNCITGVTLNGSAATVTNGVAALTFSGGGGGGDTSNCVHLTGDETIGGNKTFTDSAIFSSETQVVFTKTSGGGGSSGTTGITAVTMTQAVEAGAISLMGVGVPDWGSPIAAIAWCTNPTIDTTQRVVSFTGNLSGGTGATDTTSSHDYVTLSYRNGTWETSGSVLLAVGTWCVTYFYSQGGATLTIGVSSFSPGSGTYQCTFTGNTLTGTPAYFLMQLESQVRNENYRRVSFYGQDSGATNTMGLTFGSNTVYTTTQYFNVSYNNGLVINSGNQNTGGYTHNPGNYRLYYVMGSQIYDESSTPLPPQVTSYTLSDIIQPVPAISTNITADATSDVKTASPKAVKTYVDNNIPTVPTISTNITSDASSDTKTASPKAVKTYVDNNIPTVPTISTNIVNDRADNSKTASPAAVYTEIHPTTASSYTNMVPNKFYNLGTITGTRSFTFSNPTDTSIENEYMLQFSTSSTAPTITWPSQITAWLGGSAPTLNANKTYQVSVLNGLAVYGEF